MNYGKKRTRKREHELASKGTMIRKKFNVIFCKALLICFFAVVIVGGCSAFGVISGIIASAPSIEDIDATPTGYLTTVLDNQGNQTATLVASGSNRKYVTINEIPINLQHAFVAIEDERFYQHHGIDPQGIGIGGQGGVRAQGDFVRMRFAAQNLQLQSRELFYGRLQHLCVQQRGRFRIRQVNSCIPFHLKASITMCNMVRHRQKLHKILLNSGGDSGGEAASLREAPLPQTPSPEE